MELEKFVHQEGKLISTIFIGLNSGGKILFLSSTCLINMSIH